jgi:hypothetical protein
VSVSSVAGNGAKPSCAGSARASTPFDSASAYEKAVDGHAKHAHDAHMCHDIWCGREDSNLHWLPN